MLIRSFSSVMCAFLPLASCACLATAAQGRVGRPARVAAPWSACLKALKLGMSMRRGSTATCTHPFGLVFRRWHCGHRICLEAGSSTRSGWHRCQAHLRGGHSGHRLVGARRTRGQASDFGRGTIGTPVSHSTSANPRCIESTFAFHSPAGIALVPSPSRNRTGITGCSSWAAFCLASRPMTCAFRVKNAVSRPNLIPGSNGEPGFPSPANCVS